MRVDKEVLRRLALPYTMEEVYHDGAEVGSEMELEFGGIPYSVGDEVEGNYNGFGVWYPAVITGMRQERGGATQVCVPHHTRAHLSTHARTHTHPSWRCCTQPTVTLRRWWSRRQTGSGGSSASTTRHSSVCTHAGGWSRTGMATAT